MNGPTDDSVEPLDPRIADAGEYVLGTLEGAERERFEERLARDPELAEFVAFWRVTLLDWAPEAERITPGDAVWRRIAAEIGDAAAEHQTSQPAARRPAPEPTPPDRLIDGLRRRARNWRAAALGAGLAAATGLAALALVLLTPVGRTLIAPEQPEMGPAPLSDFALLTDAAGAPRFLLESQADGTVAIRPIGVPAPGPDRDYELWMVGETGPTSLGVLPEGDGRIVDIAAEAVGRTVFAISIEPEGGSPTDAPTGEVVFVTATPEEE